jgi:hypothetical protein
MSLLSERETAWLCGRHKVRARHVNRDLLCAVRNMNRRRPSARDQKAYEGAVSSRATLLEEVAACSACQGD